MYGSHPAGEGGEYETLTLSSPLTTSRLDIIDSEVIITDPEPNLVAYLKIRKAELVPKSAEELARAPSVRELRRMLGLPRAADDTDGSDDAAEAVITQDDGAACLDAMGKEALEDLAQEEERLAKRSRSAERDPAEDAEEALSSLSIKTAGPRSLQAEEELRFAKRGRWFTISTSASSQPTGRQVDPSTENPVGVGDQVRSCFDRIKGTISPAH